MERSPRGGRRPPRPYSSRASTASVGAASPLNIDMLLTASAILTGRVSPRAIIGEFNAAAQEMGKWMHRWRADARYPEGTSRASTRGTGQRTIDYAIGSAGSRGHCEDSYLPAAEGGDRYGVVFDLKLQRASSARLVWGPPRPFLPLLPNRRAAGLDSNRSRNKLEVAERRARRSDPLLTNQSARRGSPLFFQGSQRGIPR